MFTKSIFMLILYDFFVDRIFFDIRVVNCVNFLFVIFSYLNSWFVVVHGPYDNACPTAPLSTVIWTALPTSRKSILSIAFIRRKMQEDRILRCEGMRMRPEDPSLHLIPDADLGQLVRSGTQVLMGNYQVKSSLKDTATEGNKKTNSSEERIQEKKCVM